ncbi:MAG TPA: argininosuccinate synthase [Candidatus Marinimicrobia bacterium]|nr:argininosuccinate synthase [Candidatus Neomarinimicrobiota bacterium]HPB00540.1 argininosuccinate synthase [Candidatus Neomarinimicrobiota bacterium]HQE95288.1 argininosuccinate synthase [Candidatus Neomarinimicrobiota bacterium]HQH55897.1 argininosuccinate synthase [Candidatus Neomarinimicrobiota bacterium]HQK12050.1 argininosuccinate synthase [Candidatus Neomarinimicrobiota bacterium]
MSKKVILAYSGGLDTSVILKWLVNKGYDVICYVANVGQREDFAAVEQKAFKTGASKVYIEDLRREFVNDYIFAALRGNAIYEGRYLLGTSLARPLIAQRQVEIAQMEKTHYYAHGATGKGNDQVRFEFAYYALDTEAIVISPWKDPEFLAEFKGRSDLIRYAEKWNIPVKASLTKSYSEDENLMHISHEAGVLEDPSFRPPENVFSWTVSPQDAPDSETILEIEFKDGYPIKVTNLNNGVVKEDSLELFYYLNEIGSQNGVGRVDMVENRFVGIKSRGVYETPGATILWTAHRDLEGIAMDKEVMHLRDMLSPKFAELIYNGFWFSPEMDFLMNAFEKSQEKIDGSVTVSIYKGNVTPIGRRSPISLYDQALSSMDIAGGFNANDSLGFIRVNALRLKAHKIVLKKKKPYNWRIKD